MKSYNDMMTQMIHIEEKEIQNATLTILYLFFDNSDLNKVAELEKELYAIKYKTHLIVLDLNKVHYLDASALGVIFRFQKYLKRKRKKLALVGANKPISLVLKLSDPNKNLSSFSDIGEALNNMLLPK